MTAAWKDNRVATATGPRPDPPRDRRLTLDGLVDRRA